MAIKRGSHEDPKNDKKTLVHHAGDTFERKRRNSHNQTWLLVTNS